MEDGVIYVVLILAFIVGMVASFFAFAVFLSILKTKHPQKSENLGTTPTYDDQLV